MIVWGGFNGFSYLNTGGRYDPEHRQLDSHQHHQRARCPSRSHGSLDRQRNDRLGRKWQRRLFEHRREIRSQHRQLDSHQHHQRARLRDTSAQAVWTGSEMIVWGGYAGSSF